MPRIARRPSAGDKFAAFTVIEPAPNIGKEPASMCECECGNRVPVRNSVLLNGRASCCLRCKHNRQVIDLTGYIYGLLTVIERDRSGYWKCKCKCGTICSVKGSHLKDGLTNCCGRSCKWMLEAKSISIKQSVSFSEALEYIELKKDIESADYDNSQINQLRETNFADAQFDPSKPAPWGE